MKKINNLLARLESMPASDSTVLSEPHALAIRGGKILPTTNGTCSGNNDACTNKSCDGTSNGVCSNDSCFA